MSLRKKAYSFFGMEPKGKDTRVTDSLLQSLLADIANDRKPLPSFADLFSGVASGTTIGSTSRSTFSWGRKYLVPLTEYLAASEEGRPFNEDLLFLDIHPRPAGVAFISPRGSGLSDALAFSEYPIEKVYVEVRLDDVNKLWQNPTKR
jgi:hypothetical protein